MNKKIFLLATTALIGAWPTAISSTNVVNVDDTNNKVDLLVVDLEKLDKSEWKPIIDAFCNNYTENMFPELLSKEEGSDNALLFESINREYVKTVADDLLLKLQEDSEKPITEEPTSSGPITDEKKEEVVICFEKDLINHREKYRHNSTPTDGEKLLELFFDPADENSVKHYKSKIANLIDAANDILKISTYEPQREAANSFIQSCVNLSSELDKLFMF